MFKKIARSIYNIYMGSRNFPYERMWTFVYWTISYFFLFFMLKLVQPRSQALKRFLSIFSTFLHI